MSRGRSRDQQAGFNLVPGDRAEFEVGKGRGEYAKLSDLGTILKNLRCIRCGCERSRGLNDSKVAGSAPGLVGMPFSGLGTLGVEATVKSRV